MPLLTPLFSPISSPPRLSTYPPIFSTISPTILLGDLLDDGILKSDLFPHKLAAFLSASDTPASSTVLFFNELLIFFRSEYPILYPQYSLLRFTHIRAKSVAGINSPRFNPL
ncbi:hypothetical protein PGTUg99_033972 [Puccinia graminis f. sp. tritici]|uniref:Uncharacterized protein n=1 Tax=Puccinia graminis f. sp. tritici TaxID=56615 RepID=A0A5B0Q9W6_PUCGR|nr:hypothetical protein PGTUg99_033972 [Puccinia graminis f. sp. tritici]